VTGTGTSTAIGDIHTSIVSQISQPTPLKQKLDDFGDLLAKVITVICILVWLINYRNFADPAHHGWFKGAIYYVQLIPCAYSDCSSKLQLHWLWLLSQKA
jgi:Ca2+ transporting ATPase